MLSSPLTMRRSSRTSAHKQSNDPVPRSGPPRSCYVAVLGCSGPRTEAQSGVGKSSLCARFVNPGLDAYNAVKPDMDESVLAWMDFVEPEINQEHFLYYGSSARRLSGNTTAVVHVLEQTEFLDEASVGRTAYPTPGTYLQRATMRYLQSPGKIAYTRRANIGSGITSGAKPLPPALASKGLSGYVLVFDPTARDDRKQQQLTLLAKLVDRLPRELPIVLAITKCDQLSRLQLERLSGEHEELARCLQQQRGRPVPCVHSSAEMGVNVDVAFMLLAARSLGVDVADDTSATSSSSSAPFVPYLEAYAARHAEIRELQRELAGAVTDLTQQFQTRWHPVYDVLRRMPAYRRLCDLVGYEGVRRLFLARLLEIKMEDMKNRKDPPPVTSTTTTSGESGQEDGGAEEAVTSGDRKADSFQKLMYEDLEKSLEQHPDVRNDAKQVAEIYEDLEQVREARTWPRQSTASARQRDSRGTMYFPIATGAADDQTATLRSSDGKQRHSSCPTFRKARPTTLLLDAEAPAYTVPSPPRLEMARALDDMPEISQTHTSPRLNNKNQRRPRSMSPRHRGRGLLDRLRRSSPSPAAETQDAEPPASALLDAQPPVEVRHARSNSLQLPQNELSPSYSLPTVSADDHHVTAVAMDIQKTLSAAKSLPYLPIVIPLKQSLFPAGLGHTRSASLHYPRATRPGSSGSGGSASSLRGPHHFPLAVERRSPAPPAQQQQPLRHAAADFGSSNIYAQPMRKSSAHAVPPDVPSPIYRELEAAVADLGTGVENGGSVMPVAVDAALGSAMVAGGSVVAAAAMPMYAELEANAASEGDSSSPPPPHCDGRAPAENGDDLLNTLV